MIRRDDAVIAGASANRGKAQLVQLAHLDPGGITRYSPPAKAVISSPDTRSLSERMRMSRVRRKRRRAALGMAS